MASRVAPSVGLTPGERYSNYDSFPGRARLSTRRPTLSAMTVLDAHVMSHGLSAGRRFSTSSALDDSSNGGIFKSVLEEDIRKHEFIAVVADEIKRKECIRFVQGKKNAKNKDEPAKCHCGEVPEKHIKGTAGITEFFNGVDFTSKLADMNDNREWNAEKDIREFPTNAFGQISFINEGLGGHKPAKYLRVADDTPVDSIIELLIHHWDMLKPHPANLVITVIGGAKNFRLDGKKKEIFNRGLVNAAKTTLAWIITSGFNMGVMKAVGEAVAEGQSYYWDKTGLTHTLRCIGIAPWGYVDRRENLISKDGGGSWNANYKCSAVIQHGKPVSLNPDHTHFLLVDDGFRGRYGGVGKFRASLERKISLPAVSQSGETGLGIPVVLVVVEGGYDAILDVENSMKQGIPVVICEGTGRAADIIAFGYTHCYTNREGNRDVKPHHRLMLEHKIRHIFGKTWADRRQDVQKEVDTFTNIVVQCCKNENLITVFDMNKAHDLDLAILSALLKGQGAKDATQLLDQLNLALTWNRSDVAEEKIFTNQVTWPTDRLHEIMTKALIEDKIDFVRLLLQNGVIMKEYLTVPRLRKLYNSAPKMSHLRQLLSRQTRYPIFLLRDVDRLLRKLMTKHNDAHYDTDCDVSSVMKNEESYNEDSENSFPKPFRELFLWAVLMNRRDLAKFLWERCDETIPSAIAASCIYGALAHQVAHYDSDLLSLYDQNKQEFERLAIKVLDECQNTDPEKAGLLIEHKYATWGDMSCLEMAAAADSKEFLSTVCCQNSLNCLWKRGVASSWPKIVLGLVCFPTIFCLVRFQNSGEESEPLTPFEKIRLFYRSPTVKFAGNVMMYLVFLATYSYMILFEFRPEIRPLEIVVLIWMGTFIVEELREMFFGSTSDKIQNRIRDWWNFSFFNRIDLLIIVLAVLGAVIRIFPQHFIAAKTTYSINCVFLFVRLLRDYSASSYLGPKLVMITKMMKELLLYVMILAVFLLAYGISINAVMFPQRDFYSNIFRDIFYYPYWQISGELYLEELEGRSEACLKGTPVNGIVYDASGDPCPVTSWLVPTLTAGYLLMGNVLLLNLLIAIFTHVFEEVEVNSIQIWKYGMYFLVVEYNNKPSLAPPFIIFEHIFLFIKFIFRKTCCPAKKPVTWESIPGHLDLLQIFEKEMTRSYIRKHEASVSRSGVETYIPKIMHRVEEMVKLMEEDKMLEQQHYEEEKHKRAYKHTHHQQQASGPSPATGRGPDGPARHAAGKTFSRWPSLEKIKQLKMLRSIREDQSSDGGVNSNRPGYVSETGQDSMAESTMDFRNIRLPAGLSDSDTDRFRQGFDPHQPNIESESSFVDNRQAPTTASKPPPVPQVPTAQNVSPNHAIQHLPEVEPPRRLKRRKSKKKKKEKSSDDQRERNTDREKLRNYSSDSSGEFMTEGMPRSGLQKRGSHLDRGRVTEIKELNISSHDDRVVSDAMTRISRVEDRLTALEQNTSRSLYNIESLLRNALFHRGPPLGQAITSPGVTNALTGGFMESRVVAAPSRSADLPYRPSSIFPPYN